jgi:hypothetical protein
MKPFQGKSPHLRTAVFAENRPEQAPSAALCREKPDHQPCHHFETGKKVDGNKEKLGFVQVICKLQTIKKEALPPFLLLNQDLAGSTYCNRN